LGSGESIVKPTFRGRFFLFWTIEWKSESLDRLAP
jgi:hypothetical protein